MGTRTYSRRRADGTRVLTPAGRARFYQVTGLAEETGDVTKSIDEILDDPMYSLGMSLSIADAEDAMYDWANNDIATAEAMQALGLRYDKYEDSQLMSALMGTFSSDSEDNMSIKITKDRKGNPTIRFVTGNRAATSTRYITILPDRIEVVNQQFENGDGALKGQGYVMLMRQVAAVRKLGQRFGKPVDVVVHALSDATVQVAEGKDDAYWRGVGVWPRLGYEFNINDDVLLASAARQAGFLSTKTTDLMTEVNARGELGFDKWRDIVDTALARGPGQIELSGKMRPTDDNDRGLQVLLSYGKLRNYLQKQADGKRGMTDIFNMTPAEMTSLRSAWLGTTKGGA